MYAKFCRHVYLPFLDNVKKSPYKKTYKEASETQFYAPDKISEIQIDKLKKIITHAYDHSSFYHERFDSIGLNPGSITQISDISRIPLLEKNDLVENMKNMTTPCIGSRYNSSTSGSTGTSLKFQYDSYQYAWMEACRWRAREWWGAKRGDRELILWGRPLVDKKLAGMLAKTKTKFRNILHFNVFDEFNDNSMEEIWRGVKEFKPKIIYGYGSSIGKLATYLLDNGHKIDSINAPIFVEYTADHMFPFEIEAANEVFSAPVLSQYGASEAPSVSNQCKFGHSHISSDNMLVEFINQNGNPAKPGELSEIVLTTLNNYAMPLIRYRVGDFGSYSNHECECGNNLPTMDLKIGKSVDVFNTINKKGISAHIFDYINIKLMREGHVGIRQFHITQRKLDDFLLKIVRDEPCYDSTITKYKELMSEKLGKDIHIEIEFVGEIHTSPSGKRRYFETKI